MGHREKIKQQVVGYLEGQIQSWHDHLDVVFDCELSEDIACVIQTMSVNIQTMEELIEYVKKFPE